MGAVIPPPYRAMSLTGSQKEICNAALLRIGSKKISSSDTTSLEYQLGDTFYPLTVDELLKSHTWACATKQMIALSDGLDVIGRYSYPMPDDFRRLIEINYQNEFDVKYELLGKNIYTKEASSTPEWVVDYFYAKTFIAQYEGKYYKSLVSHISEEGETPDTQPDLWEEVSSGVCVYVKYVGLIEPDEFDPLFRACLIPLLSSNMATALSTSMVKTNALLTEYKDKLAFARYTDATQKRNTYGSSKWFNNR